MYLGPPPACNPYVKLQKSDKKIPEKSDKNQKKNQIKYQIQKKNTKKRKQPSDSKRH